MLLNLPFLKTKKDTSWKSIRKTTSRMQDTTEVCPHNQSQSTKGVLRGLHLQVNYPQRKLVRVIRGEVFDVGVDLRGDSKTYGEWYSEILSEDNKKQLYIPLGFAHGFLGLSDEVEFTYKCTEFYHSEDESGIILNNL